MKTKYNIYKVMLLSTAFATVSCQEFLSEQLPQGTLSEEQALDSKNTEKMIVSAYAGLTTIEDINASFSLWNYDVRSDDAYKGGANEGDGDVFHKCETGNGILPSDWNINGGDGIWQRLYNYISRTNTALALLDEADLNTFPKKATRIAEMKFLRAYGHFQLKRLFGNIPFVMDENMLTEDYYKISNTQYTDDEAWGVIADQLEEAYADLPEVQEDKGRPTKAACAALLAKVYLYKAYRKTEGRNTFSGTVDRSDLDKVLEYTDPAIYANNSLASDFHNNFRPETEFENGPEALWSIQYSYNDGSVNGNRNYGCALMAPNVETKDPSKPTTVGGHDFYKPSRNLVNAFRTNSEGLPELEDFNRVNYDPQMHNADPRLFLTVGMPGFPFMFNEDFMQEKSWARNANGLYGYNVTLKQNVDQKFVKEESYIKKCGWCWATSMNRVVLRLADVKLMRAEAFAQLGQDGEAISLVNEIRRRAAASTGMMDGYPRKYGVRFKCSEYTDNSNALAKVKFERRLELAMEAERFFDLVRWGDAKAVLDKFYAGETNTTIYQNSSFVENKLEYMPIPFNEMQNAKGLYKQNPGY